MLNLLQVQNFVCSDTNSAVFCGVTTLNTAEQELSLADVCASNQGRARLLIVKQETWLWGKV